MEKRPVKPTWRFLTADRIQMNKWTRKRRLKFRKRWRRQHQGHKFGWMVSEFKHVHIPTVEPTRILLFKRETKEFEELEISS